MIKKIICFFLLIILIPYIIISFFITKDDIKIYFNSNKNIRVKREKKNKIETVTLEKYVVGVIASEMPINFEIEALKAQAVAARSYALKKIEDNKKNSYDVVDTIKNQVYSSDEELKLKWKNNYEKNIEKVKKAVIETRGEYLTYNNKVIQAFFFSTSMGKTENSEEVFQEKLPYLRSVDSSWDKESPSYINKKEIDIKEFYQKLNLEDNNNLKVQVLKTTSTGSIKKIKINEKEYDGIEIRKKLDLKSNYFEIKKLNNKIIITTKGFGHGVGMSQYGANGMAKEGYKYREILEYYYQGTKIKKI